MRVIIAGGSGFLGRQLARRCVDAGHDVIILTRTVNPAVPFKQLEWDGKTLGQWTEALTEIGPVAVANLAGKLVDCRPTASNIAALRTSRVDATRVLVLASQLRKEPVSHWLQASTTAIYSDAGELHLDELSDLPSPGLPQMTGVAAAWEAALEGANTTSKTILRTSIVLAQGCPAWDRLTLLVRWGVGGTVGRGQQWTSWIHIEDWLRIAMVALGLDPQLAAPQGVVVASSPHPVRNRELMATLRSHLGRRGIPTPSALVTLGAIVLRTDPALALTGRFVTSTVLKDAGFTFRYPDLDTAVTHILG
ncbi:DUF1731 domain-containing protein [Nakamurella antarctica]|uniref:DUF1731 domain-containing protein n=1 Tax=Nakamurella antarctica TaxID=1902245 RepID=A0A3G8ZJM7_9ACTN|nr:DUF1731 domain-containing protein [Nakamurella antarctica]AZI57473.1 DUF1731 domain-containing protein [Nakamurella antarctica]